MQGAAAVASLVGRSTESARIDTALDALEAGSESVLAFQGEPGIGKTRMLAELATRARKRGHLVLAGAASEFERDLPFSVWIDALDAHVEARDLSQRPGWDAEVAEALGTILPSLRTAASPLVAEERFRAHRAMRVLLEILSDDQALVLMLDDLHWGDAASLELLASLLARGVGAPVLLALASRAGQAPARLAALLAAEAITHVVLEPLTAAQARELVGDEAARAVFVLSGGNPFYLQQLAGAPRTGASPQAAAPDAVPLAVAGALAAEIEALEPAARALVRGAAVAGDPFALDLAVAVAELGSADGLAALDALLAAGLLRETEIPRQFRFRHPLVRSAVYSGSPAGWRLEAHARAAATLADQGASAVEQAVHFERSAGPGDAAAIALLARAGELTSQRAPAASARWYAAALRLLGSGERERRADLLVELASAQRAAGELEACRESLLAAAELVPEADAARRCELAAHCAAVEQWLGHHADAHRRLTTAWERLDDRRGPAAAVLGVELAVDALYAMDPVTAAATAEAALATARALERPDLVARAASALALAEAVEGKTEPALTHRAEAIAIVDALEDAELGPILEAMYLLGWAENYLERYDEAIAHAERGIAVARASDRGRLVIPLMLVKPYPLEMVGRMQEAQEICEAALEAARLAENPHFLSWALFEKAWAHYYRGELEETIAACEESYRVGQKLVLSTMPASGGGPGWPLASVQLLRGEPQALLDLVAGFGDDSLPWAISVEKCFVWETMSLAARGVGDTARAVDLVERAERLSSALELKVPAGVAARARAAHELETGVPAAAVAAALEACERLAGAGAHLQAAYAKQLLGLAQLKAGARDEGIATLREAEHDFDRIGSRRTRDEVRRELRALGVRVEPRGPASAEDSGLDALTGREREIAGLVTDRLTNREIAGRLFLSEKTVETHLRNIFRKLGVSARADVARTVEGKRG